MYIFLSPIISYLQFLQPLLELPLGLDLIRSIFHIELSTNLGTFVLIDILMAPEVEVIIFTTPQLYFYRIGQIIPLIIEMNRTVSIIYLFSVSQIDHTKIVWVAFRILIKAKSKTKHIIKTLLKATVVGNCFLILQLICYPNSVPL